MSVPQVSLLRRALASALAVVALIGAGVVTAVPAAAAGEVFEASGSYHPASMPTSSAGTTETQFYADDATCDGLRVSDVLYTDTAGNHMPLVTGGAPGFIDVPPVPGSWVGTVEALVGPCAGQAITVGSFESRASDTTTTLSSSAAKASLGEPVVLTAHVAADDGGEPPVGDIWWYVDGTYVTWSGIYDGEDTGTFTLTPTRTGPVEVRAAYNGYALGWDDSEATVTVSVLADGAGTPTFSKGEGPYDWNETIVGTFDLTAAYDPPLATPAPSGTLTATGPDGVLATIPVSDDNMEMEFDAAQLTPGARSLVEFTYSGDDHYRGWDMSFGFEVDPIPVTAEVELSDLAVGAGTATVTLTAADGRLFDDGTVTVTSTDSSWTGTPVGGVATIDVAPGSQGPHTFVAGYSPATTGYAGSAPVSKDAAVAALPSLTTLGVIGAPTAGRSYEAFACTVVEGPQPGVGQTTAVLVDGDDTVLETHTGTLNSSGCVTFRFDPRGPGNFTVVASYVGSTTAGTSSAREDLTIAMNVPTVALTPGTVSVPFSHVANFHVTVSSATPEPATGTVTFSIDGDVAEVVTLESGGAYFTPSGQQVGTHTVRAEYSGDDIHDPVTTPDSTITVTQNSGTLTLDVNPSPPTLGEAATLTATLTVAEQVWAGWTTADAMRSAPVAPTPFAGSTALSGGDVTFFVNGVDVGTAPLVDGVAELQHTFVTAGSHTITAAYSGSAEVASATVDGDVAVAVAADTVAPPAAPPTAVPPAGPPAQGPPAPPADGSAAPAGPGPFAGAADLAHTGSAADTVIPLAAVLIAAGVAFSAAGRRRRPS